MSDTLYKFASGQYYDPNRRDDDDNSIGRSILNGAGTALKAGALIGGAGLVGTGYAAYKVGGGILRAGKEAGKLGINYALDRSVANAQAKSNAAASAEAGASMARNSTPGSYANSGSALANFASNLSNHVKGAFSGNKGMGKTNKIYGVGGNFQYRMKTK